VSDWTVGKGAILGTSPILLPAQCAECGRAASRGKRVETILYWYPSWIWVGLIWAVFPVALLYYAARRPLKITYSLCPEHQHTLAVKRRAVLGMWALFAAVAVAAIATFSSYLILAALALFVVTWVVHVAAVLSLRVRSYKDSSSASTGPARTSSWQRSDIYCPSPENAPTHSLDHSRT